MTIEAKTSRSPPLLSRSHALLTDFDGTLVAMAAHPDAVAPAAGLAGWLYQIEQQLGGAFAIVTGRRLASVDQLLEPLRCMGAGAHGAELRVDVAGKTKPIIKPLEPELVRAVESAVESLEGVWVENKTFALAVHFRQNPGIAAVCMERVKAAVADAQSQVDVFYGHAVVELRRKGLGKGAAAGFLLQHAAFAGRQPVFMGDDLADEEAFAVVQARGGFGIKIGADDSIASYRLADTGAVQEWLRASLMQLRRTP